MNPDPPRLRRVTVPGACGPPAVVLAAGDGDFLVDKERHEILVVEEGDDKGTFPQAGLLPPVVVEGFPQDLQHQHGRERTLDQQLGYPVDPPRVFGVEVDLVVVHGERAEPEEQGRRGHHRLGVERMGGRLQPALDVRGPQRRRDAPHEEEVLLLDDGREAAAVQVREVGPAYRDLDLGVARVEVPDRPGAQHQFVGEHGTPHVEPRPRHVERHLPTGPEPEPPVRPGGVTRVRPVVAEEALGDDVVARDLLESGQDPLGHPG